MGRGRKALSPSDASWCETGLLTHRCLECGVDRVRNTEEAAVRSAPAQWIAKPDYAGVAAEKGTEHHFAYRSTVNLDKPYEAPLSMLLVKIQFPAGSTASRCSPPTPSPLQADAMEEVRASRCGEAIDQRCQSVGVECVHYNVNPNGMAIQMLLLSVRLCMWNTTTERPQHSPVRVHGRRRFMRRWMAAEIIR